MKVFCRIMITVLSVVLMSSLCSAEIIEYYTVEKSKSKNLSLGGKIAPNEKITILVLDTDYSFDDFKIATNSNIKMVAFVDIIKADSSGNFDYSLRFKREHDCTLVAVTSSGQSFVATVNSNEDFISSNDFEVVDGQDFYINSASITNGEGLKVSAVKPLENQGMKLNNSKIKLQGSGTFKVAYIGGSITSGSGVSDQADTYRALTTKWLQDNYGNVEEIKCSIGGTGTATHLYRMNYVALSQNPDLVFIETAVNDYKTNYAESEKTKLKNETEGMIRQIYENNPETEIVFFDTITKAIRDSETSAGSPSFPKEIHMELSEKYGIPRIDGGEYLYSLISQEQLKEYAGDEDIDDGTYALSKDKVHPFKGGHKAYSQAITTEMARLFALPSNGKIQYCMEEPLYSSPFSKADIIQWDNERYVTFDTAGSASSGWVVNTDGYRGDPWNRFIEAEDSVITTKAGSSMTVRFKGSYFGINMARNTRTGDFTVSIDGQSPVTYNSYISWPGGPEASYLVVSDNLGPGVHTAVITVSGKFCGQNIGSTSSKTGETITADHTKIAINGFLVRDRLLTTGNTIHDKVLATGVPSNVLYPEFQISNIGQENISYSIFCSVFQAESGGERLVSTYRQDGEIDAKTLKQSIVFSPPITVNKGAGLSFKYYFWDGINLEPLCEIK